MLIELASFDAEFDSTFGGFSISTIRVYLVLVYIGPKSLNKK
jgi:hypothetical protein